MSEFPVRPHCASDAVRYSENALLRVTTASIAVPPCREDFLGIPANSKEISVRILRNY